MKILLIDNFDSFTENIAQYLYEVTGESVDVVDNTTDFGALGLEGYDAVVLSPGPGHPGNTGDFGVCKEIVLHATIPVLGICLGHQGIVHYLGGTVKHAPRPVHGYRSQVKHTGEGLFSGLPSCFNVVRYHSLVCTRLPKDLRAVAWTDDDLLMAVEHVRRPLWGVQFHPESIQSEHGHALLGNFVRMAITYNEQKRAKQLTAHEAWLAVGGPERLYLHVRECLEPVSPLDLFSRYCGNSRLAFWLDSENADRPDARFSFMGNGDTPGSVYLAYDVTQSSMVLQGLYGEQRVEGDGFELLGQILDAVQVDSPDSLPFPFVGGLVGYFGYELKGISGGERVHRSECPDASFLFTPHFFVFDHQCGKYYECLLTGDACLCQWPKAPNVPLTPRNKYSGCDFVPGAVGVDALSLEDNPEAYLNKIKRSLSYITDGESYEICLTNRARVSYTGVPLAAYQRMREASPVPYGAYLVLDEINVLSASPELFLRIDKNGLIESKPIKGTRSRGKNASEDRVLRTELACSDKDRAENLMIVDLVRHDLNRICLPGTVHVPALFAVESFSSVHQLVSTIRGQLPVGFPVLEAIRACFPGGSMTGAPKRRTMQIIDELEASARGVYSGALGWIGFDGGAQLSIVIRTAVLRDGQAEFGIGGAIIAHSDPQAELEETLVKASVPFHSFNGGKRP